MFANARLTIVRPLHAKGALFSVHETFCRCFLSKEKKEE